MRHPVETVQLYSGSCNYRALWSWQEQTSLRSLVLGLDCATLANTLLEYIMIMPKQRLCRATWVPKAKLLSQLCRACLEPQCICIQPCSQLQDKDHYDCTPGWRRPCWHPHSRTCFEVWSVHRWVALHFCVNPRHQCWAWKFEGVDLAASFINQHHQRGRVVLHKLGVTNDVPTAIQRWLLMMDRVHTDTCI